MKPCAVRRAFVLATVLAWSVTAVAVSRPALAANPGKPAPAINDNDGSGWKTGARWIQFRAGYAKAQGVDEPDGGGGYGFGFQRMMSDRMSLGINLQHDLLGTFGAASKIEIPVVLEMLWHYRWSAGLYPYVGGGVGAAYRYTYRTGDDQSSWQPMLSLTIGTDYPIGKNKVLGLDIRLAGVSSDEPQNPVFGEEGPRSVHWSMKLTYAVTY